MSYPIGQGTPVGYMQLSTFAANVVTAASWAATGGGQVTFTTTSGHGVPVGGTFTISGMTPAGYNGTYVAITGTTGSTLVAAKTTNPGAATAFGTLNASMSAATRLAVPPGAARALISASAAGIRFLDTGAAPSAGLGFPIASGGYVVYAGNLSTLQLIAQSGSPIVDVLFYR